MMFPNSIRNLFQAVFAAFIALAASLAMAAVDVNKANQAELETVKGIGPGLSGKILKAREAGQFKGWADLVDRVSGFGPKSAAKFSSNGLTVAGAEFSSAALTDSAKANKPAKGERGSRSGKASKKEQALAKATDAVTQEPAQATKPAKAPKANRKSPAEQG